MSIKNYSHAKTPEDKDYVSLDDSVSLTPGEQAAALRSTLVEALFMYLDRTSMRSVKIANLEQEADVEPSSESMTATGNWRYQFSLLDIQPYAPDRGYVYGVRPESGGSHRDEEWCWRLCRLAGVGFSSALAHLVEGLPGIISGVITHFILPAYLYTFKWLSEAEQAWFKSRIEKNSLSAHKHDFDKDEFIALMTNPHSYMHAAVYVSNNLALQAITFWLPTLYFVCSIATSASTAFIPVVWAWRTSTTTGTTGNATATALMNCIGNFGGVVGTFVFRSDWGPRYTPAFITLTCISLLCIKFVVIEDKWAKRDDSKKQLVTEISPFSVAHVHHVALRGPGEEVLHGVRAGGEVPVDGEVLRAVDRRADQVVLADGVGLRGAHRVQEGAARRDGDGAMEEMVRAGIVARSNLGAITAYMRSMSTIHSCELSGDQIAEINRFGLAFMAVAGPPSCCSLVGGGDRVSTLWCHNTVFIARARAFEIFS
ncbi:hypothetical protein M427DRAFT_43734 [Gonapodya prolifera JEL478]|uniref:MFS general substrate transporter n=1 Tax=Gonapodya prolifera (strain JEL478) TaxID=1344416 RepID=A0A139AHJ2_GONPJ|nr:hypothetical protein M427DRAFT_43734 [Gonapodya prolifera JEL478]|eukprot:KXS16267.1 hypothetical protein M427DRAFT_43734 [Gonapodya prolifera JEL478]